MTDDSDDIFARWSRRKREVAEEAAREVVARTPAEPVAQEPAAEDEDELALLERLGLPLPESLKAGDDFSGFMRAGVPEFLRQRALRVLWRSNPVLANLDGLNDYDDDFNSPELTKKILATGYKIGRGFLDDAKIPEILQENDKEEQIDHLNHVRLPDENPLKMSPGQETPEASSEGPSETDQDVEISFNPRRMRFEN